jgi:hypothetical protein
VLRDLPAELLGDGVEDGRLAPREDTEVCRKLRNQDFAGPVVADLLDRLRAYSIGKAN